MSLGKLDESGKNSIQPCKWGCFCLCAKRVDAINVIWKRFNPITEHLLVCCVFVSRQNENRLIQHEKNYWNLSNWNKISLFFSHRWLDVEGDTFLVSGLQLLLLLLCLLVDYSHASPIAPIPPIPPPDQISLFAPNQLMEMHVIGIYFLQHFESLLKFWQFSGNTDIESLTEYEWEYHGYIARWESRVTGSGPEDLLISLFRASCPPSS